MSDDLVKRLRTRQDNEHQTADLDALEAADRIEELEERIRILLLENCRLIITMERRDD